MEIAETVDELLDERYSASSDRTISGALAHWDTCREQWAWPQVIQTGDRDRGGMLATFVVFLMGLKITRGPTMGCFYPANSIFSYVWGLCAYMVQKRQLDPRTGVINWEFFASAVRVVCHVPAEPRKRVPFAVLLAALEAVDLNDFAMVQMAVFAILLFFTFQRAEFPCATSRHDTDSSKICRVRDMEPYHGGSRWAIGATKADQRAERVSGNAGPGREWVVIGEVEGICDLRVWLARLFAFYPSGPRDPDSSFFRAHDKVGPLTYNQALKDFRAFLSPVVPDPSIYGIHGLRVEGYFTCVRAVGEMAAIVVGGWQPGSHDRYDRLPVGEQFLIAPKMLNFYAKEPLAVPAGIHGSRGDLGPIAARAAAVGSTRAGTKPLANATVRVLPEGWTRVARGDGKGFTFLHTSGARSKTIKGIAQMSFHVVAPARAQKKRTTTPVIQPMQAPAKRKRAPPAIVVSPGVTGPFKGPICGTTLPTGFCHLRQGHLGFCC